MPAQPPAGVGPDAEALAAARSVLATLSAGRAALLQLAGAHLPFDRVLALHRAAADEGAWFDEAGGMVERRLAVSGRLARLSTPSFVAPPPSFAAPTPSFVAPPPPVAPVRRAPPRAAAPAPTPAAPSPMEVVDPVNIPSATPHAANAMDGILGAGPEAVARALLQERTPAPRYPSASHTLPPAAYVTGPILLDVPIEPAARVAERTSDGIGAAEATGVNLEPADTPTHDLEPLDDSAISENTSAGPAVDAAEDTPLDAEPDDSLAPLVREDHVFSRAGENTSSWGNERAPVTIDDLLGSAPSADDATQIDASPLLAPPGSDELSAWAATALGASEPAPATRTRAARPARPPARDIDADAPPTLHEPLVEGSSRAMLDVRAAASGPTARLAAPEDIEVLAEPTGEDAPTPDENTGPGFQVTFERGAAPPPRPQRTSAPRLTDDTDNRTNPAALPPRAAVVPDEKHAIRLLADAGGFARKGDLQKAIQAFTDALDMRPSDIEAYIGRGRCYLELGDYSSAMSDFARAEDLAPDRPDAHVATGDLYFARKEYKRAIEFYDQAVELDGSHAMGRCRRGISHYYRKNYRQALQDLQRALALDPEIPNIRKYVQMAQKKLDRGE